MDTMLIIVAVMLVIIGLLSGVAIFLRALTGHRHNQDPATFMNLWPLCAGGLFVGILLMLLLKGCSDQPRGTSTSTPTMKR